MFKLIKLLGRFVSKMYIREARLLTKEASALRKVAVKAEKVAAESRKIADESIDKSARIALQGQTLGKFFE